MSERKFSGPVVLTIAGFDPSGAAGIIADVRTIQTFACFPVAAIASITFQNSESFLGAIHQTGESVRAQVTSILGEYGIAALKVGMLPTAEVVRTVATLVREGKLPAPVVDPVLRSTSGHALIEEDAIELLKRDLFPLARVVTPNIPEAEKLTGLNIRDESGMCAAAEELRHDGARAVLIKGGHLTQQSPEVRAQGSGYEAVDVLNEDGHFTVFRGEWIDAMQNVRGTGCMLTSAIASGLAQKKSLDESVRQAKDFVAEAIRQAQISKTTA